MEEAVRSIPRGFRTMVYIIVFNIFFKEFIYVGLLISVGKMFEGSGLFMVASHGGIVRFVC